MSSLKQLLDENADTRLIRDFFLGSLTSQRPKKFHQKIAKGLQLYDAAEYQKAIVNYNEGLKHLKSCYFVYRCIGDCYYKLKDYNQSLFFHEKALQLNPRRCGIYCDKGKDLYRLERYDEAIETFELAIKLSPADHNAHFQLGNVYRAKRDLDGALRSYITATILNPYDADYSYMRALIYEERGQISLAIASYQSSIKIKPGKLNLMGFADLLFTLEHYAEALEYYLKAREYCDSKSLKRKTERTLSVLKQQKGKEDLSY